VTTAAWIRGLEWLTLEVAGSSPAAVPIICEINFSQRAERCAHWEESNADKAERP
jgi:hypothetical protein